MGWASWKQAMVLSSTAESYQGLSKAFRTMAPTVGITIRFVFEFEQTDVDSNDLDPTVFDQMRKTRTRVVIALGYDRNMKRIALQAWDLGLMAKGWAWIGPGDILAAEAAKLDNSQKGQRIEDAKRAFSGWLYFVPDAPVSLEFSKEVLNRSASDFNVSVTIQPSQLHPGATAMYDAVMLWAKACTDLTLQECKENTGNIVFERMKTVSFLGKSGYVKLDANGDLIPPSFAICNYVRSERYNGTQIVYTMSSKVVGRYQTANKSYATTNLAIVWPGEVTTQPSDTGSPR